MLNQLSLPTPETASQFIGSIYFLKHLIFCLGVMKTKEQDHKEQLIKFKGMLTNEDDSIKLLNLFEAAEKASVLRGNRKEKTADALLSGYSQNTVLKLLSILEMACSKEESDLTTILKPIIAMALG